MYHFVKDERAVTLVSLTPRQVYEDQLKLRSREEKKSNERQNESMGEDSEVANCKRKEQSYNKEKKKSPLRGEKNQK